MNTSLKVSISIVCVFVLLFTLSAPALASTIHPGSDVSADVNDEQLVQMMKSMGLNNVEILYLMELEHARREGAFTNSSLNSFPSNPYIGQRYPKTTRIHFSTITRTVSGIAGALIAGGVGAGIAVVLADAILNEWNERQDARGVDVTIEYVYGRDNHGGVGWTAGPQSWALFY